ncbi:MAG: NAD-dependent epimerase/dehydratase family protein [Solirubrobacteraceae bacterium]
MLTGRRSELAPVVAREHAAHGAPGRARVLVNLALQPPNSLLHDGHAWWRGAPHHILASTRRALAEAERSRAGFMVHASYAFAANVDAHGEVGDRLQPIIDAAVEAEALVLGSGRRACVVRLGYLYGPDMRDLRAYRRAFALGRPYWAGPRASLQHFVHADDAARALLHAARTRPAGGVVYATDGTPAPFVDFMDHFAKLCGRGHPLHLPRASRPFVHAVVREEHQQMTDIGASGHAVPALEGFVPVYAGYRDGLAQVIAAWSH